MKNALAAHSPLILFLFENQMEVSKSLPCLLSASVFQMVFCLFVSRKTNLLLEIHLLFPSISSSTGKLISFLLFSPEKKKMALVLNDGVNRQKKRHFKTNTL